MNALLAFIRRQNKLERRNRGFLDLLEEASTVRLSDILENTETYRNWAPAQWLDGNLLRTRLERGITWLSELPPHERVPGIGQAPLFFLQTSWPAADYLDLQARDSPVSWLLRNDLHGADPQVCYTHWGTNFSPELVLFTTHDGWRIGPRMHYSYQPGHSLCTGVRARSVPTPKFGSVLGYQIPHLPSLLRISQRTATEYLARIIIHDLGHSVLPNIGRPEELHDRMMIWAGGAFEEKWRPENDNERVIYAECTDPLFFLRKLRYRPGNNRTLRYLAKRMQGTEKQNLEYRKALWGKASCSHATRVANIMERLHYECSNGFPGYQR